MCQQSWHISIKPQKAIPQTSPCAATPGGWKPRASRQAQGARVMKTAEKPTEIATVVAAWVMGGMEPPRITAER
jgi:hypothetical protein